MINDFVIAKNDSVRDGCVVIGGCSSTAFCNSILESKEIYFDIFFRLNSVTKYLRCHRLRVDSPMAPKHH